MASKGQLDDDLVELFINENVYDKYREQAKKSNIPQREYSPDKNHLFNIKRKAQGEKIVSDPI